MGSSPERIEPAEAGDKIWLGHYAFLGTVCALVIGIYVWSAQGGPDDPTIGGAAENYYNLLVRGFREGQLSVKRETPAELARISVPYAPAVNYSDRHPLHDLDWVKLQGLHDLSYYRGKLYLYFGVTPALLLFWPWYELTGHFLPHREAVLIFCVVGFVAGAGLLWAVWRRYFGKVNVRVVVAGTLALGLANFIPALLSCAEVYEVAISCGYALTMLALVAVWCALDRPTRRGWWLAAASLSYGLAVGARPSLLFGAVILLVPVGLAWREQRRVSSLLLAAGGPIVLIGLGLAFYNYLRFDNPFEFGQRYQLPVNWHQQFSPAFLWFNFRVSFLEPAHWNTRFPFVHGITPPLLPRDYFMVWNSFGALTNMPLVWLALAAPLVWRDRLAQQRSILHSLLAAVALLFGTCALTLVLHDSMCLRYEVEFASPLVLLAVLGMFGLERALAARTAWRRASRWGCGLLLASSVTFNLFAGFGLRSEAYGRLGNGLSKKGQMGEAIIHYQKALVMEPANAEAHTGLGMALFQVGRVAEASSHFVEALRLRPGLDGGHYNLGKALFRMSRLPEAIEQYERALRLKPNDVQTHNDLGVALFQQGQVPEAIGHLEEALRLQPDHTEAHNNLGKALFQLGRMPEAAGHWEQVLRANPEDAEARNNLGTALFGLGKVPEAVEQYEQALRRKPDFAKARNNLGIALAQLAEGLAAQGKWDEAIPHYQEALQLDPNDPRTHNNLANALAEQGKLEEAIQHYTAALQLQRDNPELHYKLGLALARQGRRAEAMQHLAEALRLRPGYAEARRQLDALAAQPTK